VPDPFESLRLPVTPARPGPVFTQRLRARIERALGPPTIEHPKGASMNDLVFESPRFVAQQSVLTPYLAVAGARAAIDWYGEALGARVVGEPIIGPDGSIGHCELEVRGARFFLSDEHPEIGVSAPVPGQASVTLHLEVADADEMVERAMAAGARLERPLADYPYGRLGVLRDPFGHRWMVMAELSSGGSDARTQEVTTLWPPARHGAIGYASLWVADAGRAARFFSQALGWRLVPRGTGYQVEGQSLHHGVVPYDGRPTLFLAFAVRDLDEAARKVSASGGQAGDVTMEPWGRACMCRDDQGTQFSLFQPHEGVMEGAGTASVAGLAGDLAYVTMEVPDSEKARSFYGELLGWRFSPGSVPDGWQVEGPGLMVGLSGGHSEATYVPVYQTPDVGGTVALVREAGGTAGSPEQRPYGALAECTDDQGTRFGLWQP
jgi:uncharacterized glyoxalase superfamily protein PhnB